MTRIYVRQKNLPLKVPASAAVIGCGGAGSWAALFLAMAGVKKLILVDPDVVEDVNLNRLPFGQEDIGNYKVTALSTLIASLRPDIRLVPIPAPIEEVVTNVKEHNPEVIIDARDTVEPLPEGIKADVEIRYDGMHISLNTRTGGKRLFVDTTGIERGYTVPSWVGSAAMAGLLALYAVAVDDEVWRETSVAFHLNDIPRVFDPVRAALSRSPVKTTRAGKEEKNRKVEVAMAGEG